MVFDVKSNSRERVKCALAWTWIHREKDISALDQFLDIEAKYVKHAIVPPPPKEIIYSNELPDFSLPDFIRRSSIASLFGRFSRRNSVLEQDNEPTEDSKNPRLSKNKFRKRDSVRSCPSRYYRRNSSLDPEDISMRTASASLPPTPEVKDEEHIISKPRKSNKRDSIYSVISRSSRKSSIQEPGDISNQTISESSATPPEDAGLYGETEEVRSIRPKFKKRESVHSVTSRTSTKSSSFEINEISSRTISQMSLPSPLDSSNNFNDIEVNFLQPPKFKKRVSIDTSTPCPARKKYSHDIAEINPLTISRARNDELRRPSDANDPVTENRSRRRKFKFKRKDSIRAMAYRPSLQNLTHSPETINPEATISHIS